MRVSHVQWFQGCKKVKAQGIGVHKPEEIEEFGKNDLKVLSDILADKPFYFGDEPTTVSIRIHFNRITVALDLIDCFLDAYNTILSTFTHFSFFFFSSSLFIALNAHSWTLFHSLFWLNSHSSRKMLISHWETTSKNRAKIWSVTYRESRNDASQIGMKSAPSLIWTLICQNQSKFNIDWVRFFVVVVGQ